MATLVSTTLTRRTGSTTTVFTPKGIQNGVGVLHDVSATYQGLSRQITVSSKETNGRRTTRVQIQVPQVDTTNPGIPVAVRGATAELVVTVPNGMSTADVNDLVGYVNAATSTTVTNFNDILVDGAGVW